MLRLLLLLFLSPSFLNAQTWVWERALGTNTNDLFGGIAASANGLYLGGSFEGNLNLGTTSINSQGDKDIFITKLGSETGIPEWTVQAGGLDEDRIFSMDVLNNGNLILCGAFWDEISFDALSVSPTMASRAAFLSCYDANGEIQWAKALSSAGNLQANKVQGLANGDFVLCGYFSNNLQIENQIINAQGEEDLFVARFDEAGNLLWLRRAGLLGKSRAVDVDGDALGNVYVAGQFDYQIAFSGDTIEAPIIDEDVFLLKYNPQGTELWAMEAGGVFEDLCTALEVDPEGNAYLSGYFTRNLYFGTIDLHTSLFEFAIFLAQVDSTGSPVWARSIGTPESYNYSLDLEFANDRLWLPGYFRGDTQVDWAAMTSGDPLVYDSFIASFAKNGGFIWAQQLAGPQNIFAKDISWHPSTGVYVAGEFQGLLDFDPTSSLNAGQDYDLFVANRGILTSIKSLETKSEIEIYPNPAVDKLYISMSKTPLQIDLLDCSGRSVQQWKNEEVSQGLNLSRKLTTGIYYLKIEQENFGPSYHKVVILKD